MSRVFRDNPNAEAASLSSEFWALPGIWVLTFGFGLSLASLLVDFPRRNAVDKLLYADKEVQVVIPAPGFGVVYTCAGL